MSFQPITQPQSGELPSQGLASNVSGTAVLETKAPETRVSPDVISADSNNAEDLTAHDSHEVREPGDAVSLSKKRTKYATIDDTKRKKLVDLIFTQGKSLLEVPNSVNPRNSNLSLHTFGSHRLLVKFRSISPQLKVL